MKQIVDKLNKIAKKIDESVEIPQTDLIIDSLDAITKAYGGTPNDSNLIVDKLEDIYNNVGPAVSGNIEITENGENINVAPYATATVNVSGGGEPDLLKLTVTIENSNESTGAISQDDTNIYLWGFYFLDNTIAYAGDTPIEYTLAKGESISIDLYYSYEDSAVGIGFPKDTGITASNIVNLTVDASAPDFEPYTVTDSTVNSSIKLTCYVSV